MGIYLELRIDPIVDDMTTVRVANQKYRNLEFYPPNPSKKHNTSWFIASNGICLASKNNTQYTLDSVTIRDIRNIRQPHTLFVRGSHLSADNFSTRVPSDLINHLIVAVDEYNSAMSMFSPCNMLEF